jgi:hypothetical protein|nr:hypothetical protein [Neorhizobium tomejilense]
MSDFAFHIGTIPFSASIAAADGIAMLGISVETSRGKWTDALGAKKVVIDPDGVLTTLTSLWTKIAGPYVGQPNDRFSFNLAGLVSPTAPGPVTFVRDGLNVSFLFGDKTVKMGSESVIPIEVLLALGNQLAGSAPPHLAQMWRRVSDATELPPFPRQTADMSTPLADTRQETKWYASALGQSVAYYELVANWLHARQLAFAVGAPGHTEPTREEYDVRTVHKDVPSMYAIDAIYGLSKDKLGFGIRELREQAISHRNMEARLHVVFRKFFPVPE